MTYLRDEHDSFLDQKLSPMRVWAGKVATNAIDFEDRVSVVIPGMDGGTLRWEEVRWQPRNNNQLPKRGDACVLVMDDNGEMWIPVWWPVDLLTGGDADWLTGTGTPNVNTGNTGDFYIDTDDDLIYGPKRGSVPYWPVALKGAAQSQLPARLQYGSEVNEIAGDYNLATQSGWWTGRNDDLNGPPGGPLAVVEVAAHADAWLVQTATAMDLSGSWRRRRYGGSWGSWVQVWPIDSSNLPNPIPDTNLPDRLKAYGWNHSSADLNNETASGFYWAATSTLNTPSSADNWHVHVIAGWSNYVCQIATSATFTGRIWMRLIAGGSWTPWTNLFPIDDGTLPPRLKSYTEAGANTTDWNTVKTSGWYQGNQAANAPPGGTYNYWVGTMIQWNALLNHGAQILYNIFENRVFWRRLTSDAWGPWLQIYPVDPGSISGVVPDASLPARLGPTALSVADWNSANQDGYYYSGSVPNAPIQGYWLIGHVTAGASGIVQVVTARDLDQTWFRRYNGSSWTSWIQTWPIPATSIPINDSNLPVRLAAGNNYVTNLDTCYENGWYPWGGMTTVGSPAPSLYGYCYVQNLGAGNVLQLAYRYDTNDAWMRRKKDSGAWGAWIQTYIDGKGTVVPTRLERDTTTYGDTVTDWNNARENGWHQGPPGTTNAPDGNWYLGQVVSHRAQGTGLWITQELWAFTSGTFSEPRWRRACLNDGWTSWQRIADQWIQQGHYTSVTVDDNFAATIWFPVAFPGYPAVVFSSYNDGEYAKLMLTDVQPSYFRIGGVNYGPGRGITLDWIASYK